MSKTERKVIFLRVDPSVKAAISEQAELAGTSVQAFVMDAVATKLESCSDVTREEVEGE